MSEGAAGAGEALLDRVFPVLIAGPSGAGKTTIRDRLVTGGDGHCFVFSVSMTTRAPRDGERDGGDYRFVDRKSFLALVGSGDMLEHAEVHGELYGTPRDNLERARREEAHLLLDIDVQGARQVRASVRGIVTIFILPPTGHQVLERLRGRGSETDAQLRRRLASAEAELAALSEFDYVVINDDLDHAVQAILAIVDAEGRAIARLGARAEAIASALRDEIGREML